MTRIEKCCCYREKCGEQVGGVETRRVEEVIGNLGLQCRSENKAEVAHVGSSVHGQCLKSQGG